MSVFWLLQEKAQVEPGSAWLSPSERTSLAALRFPKRRDDWRLGRWTAKQALAAVLGEGPFSETLAGLEIENDPQGAPGAFRGGRCIGRAISISHRDGAGLCAVAPAGLRVGCDLETVEPHGDAFARDYFDTHERARIESAAEEDRAPLVALMWSAKESALKALGIGLRRDTRELRVELPSVRARDGWQALRVRTDDGQDLYGWWLRTGARLLTLVTNLEGEPPVALAAWRGP